VPTILAGRAWVRQVRRDWTIGARGWERWEPQLLGSLAAVDSHLCRALALKPGHRVLNFGCGSGEPALALAPLVAPGTVVANPYFGIRIAAVRPLLEIPPPDPEQVPGPLRLGVCPSNSANAAPRVIGMRTD
jgi:SAM-dependent methyltransferase